MTAQPAAAHARTGANSLLRVVAAISTLSGWIAAGMMLLAVLITCQMIFVRFVLNRSTIWQTETVVYLMLGATLVGLSYVQRHRGHVNVDVLPRVLPMGLRRLLALLTLLLTIVIMAMMAFYGAELWYEAWSRNW